MNGFILGRFFPCIFVVPASNYVHTASAIASHTLVATFPGIPDRNLNLTVSTIIIYAFILRKGYVKSSVSDAF
jgi:hypothetical protein